ncbi:MAG: hypothetical protein ACTHL1_05970 [Burkholderiaceae bacterium]
MSVPASKSISKKETRYDKKDDMAAESGDSHLVPGSATGAWRPYQA